VGPARQARDPFFRRVLTKFTISGSEGCPSGVLEPTFPGRVSGQKMGRYPIAPLVAKSLIVLFLYAQGFTANKRASAKPYSAAFPSKTHLERRCQVPA